MEGELKKQQQTNNVIADVVAVNINGVNKANPRLLAYCIFGKNSLNTIWH